MSDIRLALSLVLTLIFSVACDSAPPPSGPQYDNAIVSSAKLRYYLAIHPLHNPKKLAEAYQPLIDYLNANIPEVSFLLEATRDYQVYEEKFCARSPELLLPNPWHTLEAIKVGYRVIAMAGDTADFKATCIMPQYFLYQHGLDINRDIDNVYVGSQESSIMNAYLGRFTAATTWPPPWRLFQHDHPEQAAQLKLILETPPLMNNSVMARDDVPTVLSDKVQALLVSLQQTPAGNATLTGMSTARFHVANNTSYDRVRDYIATFEQDVRPVELK